MEITYKREMKHNYLIMCPEQADHCGYESRMLVSNSIQGLLKFRLRYLDSKEYYYYEITSKQPLKRLLENRCITLIELRRFMIQMIQTLNRMESYLLKEGQILLEADYIYITPENFDVHLCLVPGQNCDFPQEVTKLLQYLLGKVDHQDKECVVLAYGLYQESLKDNYGMEDLMALLMHKETAETSQEHQEEYKDNEIPEHYSAEIVYDKRTDGKRTSKSNIVPPNTYNLGKIAGGVGMTAIGWAALYWLVGFPTMIPYALVITAGQVLIWRRYPKGYSKDHPKDQAEEKNEKTAKRPEDLCEWKAVLEDFDEPRAMPCEEKPAEMYIEKSGVKRSVENRPKDNRPEVSRPDIKNNSPQKRVEQGDTVLLTSLDEQQILRRLVSLDEEEDILINYFPFILGKQEGLVDHVLLKDTVSRLHLRIDHDGEGYQVMDLNSTNGTRVNGRLLDANETIQLEVGDEIFVANVRFRFI